MSFFPTGVGKKTGSGGVIPGEGPRDAKICLVGEAGGKDEDRLKRPFVGSAGRVLDQCLHAAGIIRAEVYLTNVVKIRPYNNDISPFYKYNSRTKQGRFSDEGWAWVQELYEELNELKPNIIVALGNVPMAALTRRKGNITIYRGYIEETPEDLWTVKVLPTLHPSSTFFRGENEGGTGGGAGKGASPYIGRYYITHDLIKAKKHSDTPDLIRPDRKAYYKWSSAKQVVDWLWSLADTGRVSTDIEMLNFEVSCISFASEPKFAIGFPLSDRYKWSLQEEAYIIRNMGEAIFQNEKVVKVLQNNIFDLWVLFTKYGILTKGPVEDTMIGHSIMYPEFQKNLGFLGSIYCGAQEYWKDMVAFDDIKEFS